MEEERVYRYRGSESETGLRLYVRVHAGTPDRDGRPCIVFFHGAGFSTNLVTPRQFEPHARHFAQLGMVAVCAEYRPLDHEGLFSPIESLRHARSAIRWVREHADVLGVDPDRIVAAGASAGGYLCLCAAMIDGFDAAGDNLLVDAAPNAMVIFNGGVRAGPLIEMFPDERELLAEASPFEAVRAGLPPCLMFHGTEDRNIPFADVLAFRDRMRGCGNDTRVVTFEGLGHGFFNFGNHDNRPYEQTLADTEAFLREIGMLGD